MKAGNTKILKRARRQKRIRTKVFGTSDKPRLSVFRSNKFTYAQIIDDVAGKTLVSASDIDVKKGGKLERASEVGKLVAEKAKDKKIKKVVFDRGGFNFAGRVRALAEGARANGLDF